jgi:glycosyltransferase involved in cell wall biosynthesis
MRILLTAPSMQVGGAERLVTMIAAGMVERGHEVAVVAPAGPRDEDLAGVEHQRLILDDHERSRIGAARTAAQLAGAIRQVRPDVVHAQNVKSATVAGSAARLARPGRRPAVLATFHGVLPAEYGSSAKLLRLFADHVTCVSQDARERLVATGLPAHRASLIHNAVPLPEPLSDERRAQLSGEFGLDGAPLAVVVGRMVPQKAHWRFLRAALVATEAVPGARFLVIGDGPLRQEVEATAAGTRLSGRVLFTGVRPDARDLIALSDALVFSSDWEGLSLAALEALAAGVPVVSTEVEGMRELLGGGAGVTAPLDDGTVLGQRLAEILLDRERRERMGRAGRELIAADFSVNGMLDAYEARYRAMAGG